MNLINHGKIKQEKGFPTEYFYIWNIESIKEIIMGLTREEPEE